MNELHYNYNGPNTPLVFWIVGARQLWIEIVWFSRLVSGMLFNFLRPLANPLMAYWYGFSTISAIFDCFSIAMHIVNLKILLSIATTNPNPQIDSLPIFWTPLVKTCFVTEYNWVVSQMLRPGLTCPKKHLLGLTLQFLPNLYRRRDEPQKNNLSLFLIWFHHVGCRQKPLFVHPKRWIFHLQTDPIRSSPFWEITDSPISI